MNKNMYLRLAKTNVKNNQSIYMPYIICEIIMVAMFYMLFTIHDIIQNIDFYGNGGLDSFLFLAIGITAIFAAIVILYTNVFMQKKRLKEYGLYSVLGLEKKHIIKVVFWENLMVNVMGIGVGLIFGIVFNRFIFLLLDKMVGGNSNIGFEVSGLSVAVTAVLFTIYFLVSSLMNVLRIVSLNPMELMRQTKAGEREPKSKWLMAILGVVCLGAGYYLALTVKDPVHTVDMFFVAVLFVIAGTYLLFICGSIALLKLLKKNKKFYYNRKHFITISGMLYRMKQNAAGLASICILSTAALVTMFTVISLYVGTEDCVRELYPRNIILVVGSNIAYEENPYEDGTYDEAIEAYAKEKGVEMTNFQAYYQCSVIGQFVDNKFGIAIGLSSDQTMVNLVTAKDYETLTGDKVELEPGQILIYSQKGREFKNQKFCFGDSSFDIVGCVPEENAITDVKYMLNDFITVVVSDRDELKAFNQALYDTYVVTDEENANLSFTDYYMSNLSYYYTFDLKGSEDAKKDFCSGLQEELNRYCELDSQNTWAMATDCYSEEADYMSLYGSLFFIGIFVSILFIMATSVIIYYKQVSEGYEDHDRFVIMEKVGMSQKEVKETIRSQILLVFFLPIIVAVAHVAVAFAPLKSILYMFGLVNLPLMLGCLAATVLVYLLGYLLVYSITAKTYYRLVH